MNSNISRGFSLLEVVIALLIISITFLAYNQLIEQNLKSQELKQIFIQESDKKLKLLKLNNKNIKLKNLNHSCQFLMKKTIRQPLQLFNQYEVRQILDINEISETKISSFRNFDEIKIDFITNDESVYITIIK